MSTLRQSRATRKSRSRIARGRPAATLTSSAPRVRTGTRGLRKRLRSSERLSMRSSRAISRRSRRPRKRSFSKPKARSSCPSVSTTSYSSNALAEVARSVARRLFVQPPQVWSVAGSGVLTRALQRVWPEAEFHAVQIGHAPDVGRAILHRAPERFEDDAKLPPPFPSCSNYDAKAWRFIAEHAAPDSLFWNVAK
jgi:hypothetical protein